MNAIPGAKDGRYGYSTYGLLPYGAHAAGGLTGLGRDIFDLTELRSSCPVGIARSLYCMPGVLVLQVRKQL